MRRLLQLVAAVILGIPAIVPATYAEQGKVVLHGAFVPGEVLRFEIETHTSYQSDIANGYKTDPPLLPCDYSLSANLTLKAGPAEKNGNISVIARYERLLVTNWNCPQIRRSELETGLHKFEASPIVYQLGPHGESGLGHNSRDSFSHQSAQDLLNRVTLDLLETRISEGLVAPGDSWKSRGQFTYWKDYLLNGLDLSSSRMVWKASPILAGGDYDWITSKYIFSPTENPSGPVTAGGNLMQQPSNVLSGVLDVSLLFDPRTSHIAWLDWDYVVENHISIQPVAEPDPEVLTIRWEEHAKARLLPATDGIEWLAALKEFEAAPGAPQLQSRSSEHSSSVKSDLAAIAPPKKRPTTPELDTLDFTPKGFSRWERKFCNGEWYCANVSLGLPGEVQVGEDAALETVYFAHADQSTVVVTVGPVLQRKYQGLTSEEELGKHTNFYLANQLWMENRPGVSIQSDSLVVDGYPGKITTFQGTRRDLNEVQGELLILLSPWGDSYPVTCSVKHTDFASLRDTCTRILNLVRIQRIE
jgi:hypothetical protein